ncbi:B12-binding domain-containing radical SAM protein [Patescibacteria group bacterium]
MVNHYRPPVALMYLSGYLQHKGLRPHIIDSPMKEVVRKQKFYDNIMTELKKIENQMIREFKRLRTPVVGITFYTSEYNEVFNLATRLKRIDPKVKIVVGGIHPTFYTDEIFQAKDCPIDFAIIGEGEITMYELVQAIKSGQTDFSKIKGLAYRNSTTNQIQQTPLRCIEADLDKISFPAYNLVDMEYYTNASPYAIRGVFLRSTHVLGGRGCPSQCTFCVSKKLRHYSGGGQFVRMRSPQSLVKEIEFLQKRYKIDSFFFMDDLFTLNKQNVIDFCNLLRQGRVKILWGCASKVSTLDEEVLSNMARAGCIQIEFGVERASDHALRLLKKGITVEKILDIYKICHKHKIRTYTNMLVNVPEETEQDLQDIINLLQKLKSELVSINVFIPHPGTEIYEKSKYDFTKQEYSLLSFASPDFKPFQEKLIFHKHKLDIFKWTDEQMRKTNKTWRSLKFHMSFSYWRAIMNSSRKLNYVKQLSLLIQEFVMQKF